jgi:hypothetical protein
VDLCRSHVGSLYFDRPVNAGDFDAGSGSELISLTNFVPFRQFSVGLEVVISIPLMLSIPVTIPLVLSILV